MRVQSLYNAAVEQTQDLLQIEDHHKVIGHIPGCPCSGIQGIHLSVGEVRSQTDPNSV